MSNLSRYSPEIRKKLEQALTREQMTFPRFIDEIIEKKNLVRKNIVQNAFVESQYGYKILNGTKHTKDRDLIIRLCFAMQMTQEETERALYLYGFSTLGNQQRDEVIVIALNYHFDLDQLDDLLRRCNMRPIIPDEVND